jgi:hypothetical protein
MPRIQKLLTAPIRKALPVLYANEKKSLDDAVVVVKFFSPYGNGRMTWYVTEFDGEDRMFGYVDLGQGGEWGYMSLSEIESLRVFGGRLQAVERDTSWKPTRFGDIKMAA